MLRGRHLLFFFLIFFQGRLHAFTEVIFQPDPTCSKDAVVASLVPDNNYGTFPDFIACAWTNNGNPSTNRSLVQFDLSSLPAGITIVQATLNLYHYNSPYNTGHSNLSGPDACWLERIVQPWTDMGVTWNNQPQTTIQNRVNVPASTNNMQHYTIDVTALIIDMLNDPANSYGFMLRQQTESYYRSLLFASSDMNNSVLRPKLTIRFSEDILPDNGCWQSANIYPDSVFYNPPAPSADPLVVMPNVFTPNGDAVNDVLFPDTASIATMKFSIYDRWGMQLFFSSPAKPWDGKNENGKPCGDGTYYYVLEYSSPDGRNFVLKGFFTLLSAP